MTPLIRDPSRPNLLKTRSGGACISVIGIIALLLGATVASSHLVLPDVEIPLPGKIVASLFLLAIGSLFLFLRNPTTIDQRKRVIRDETLFSFIPLKSTETSLDAYTEVEIRKEVRRSDKRTYTVYPVGLKGATTRDFGSSQTYEESRRLGELLAQFVQLPLIDYSSGEPLRREHDKLNESVADQMRRDGMSIEVPPEPSGTQLIVSESRSELSLEIPKGALNPVVLVLMLVVPVIMASTVAPIVFIGVGKSAPPPIFLVFAGLFMVIPIGVVIAAAWKNMPAGQCVILTPKTCTIIEKRPVLKKTTVLQMDEIEEIVNLKQPSIHRSNPMASFFPNRGLALRTDQQTVEIATGLDEPTKEYIDARIRQFMLDTC